MDLVRSELLVPEDLTRIGVPRIAEAEINPLIVKATGAVAVDGLIVLSENR